MRWIVLLLFGSLGLAALVGGAWWGVQRYQIVRDGVLVEGRVVAQAQHQSTRTEGRSATYRRTVTGHYPVVEFRSEDGRSWRFEGTTGGGGAPILPTGAEVSVVYRRDDPSEAIIVDFRQAWLGPLVLTIAGALFLVFGTGGFALIGRSDRHFEKLHEAMRRDALAFRQDAVRIRATVTDIRPLQGEEAGRYVLVCEGLRPRERFASEFLSEHFTFAPDRGVVGRSVEVDLDPADRETYRVHLGGLLGAISDQRR